MTKVNKWVMISAIAGIVIIECVALSRGIDGLLLTVAVASVAGIAGWTAPQLGIK